MEGHAKKCVERYCELANKTTQQLYKVSTPCIDDHHFIEEEMKSVGELSQVCSQIVLKCSYLARIGRPDILWSVNKLARSITKWTKACDKRPNRLISYIHHTCGYRQFCHVGNTAKQCRLGLFQDSDFDLEDSKSTSWGTLCVFGSHTFIPISWMCKKQTAVSHSSTESEIISSDTGLRLDGLRALELWDVIVSVFGSVSQISYRTGRLVNVDVKRKKSQGKINVMEYIVSVPSKVQSSRQEALLYVFEDNEAVIKMIIERRSPTMRHVSRTHRVALDWLFDRVNLDPKIQIKYIDTKSQLAEKEISHVMSGIICCACPILAISVLQLALIQWRSDLNKIQEKSESQQNRDLWWILLPGRHRSCRLQLQWARWRNITEVKIHGNQLLEKIDQGDLIKTQIYLKPLIITSMDNLWKASLQQVIQNWMTIVLGLVKRGKLKLRHTIDQGEPDKTSWRMVRKVRPDHEEILWRNRAIRKVRRNTSW